MGSTRDPGPGAEHATADTAGLPEFVGEIRRPRVGPLYRMGLLLTALCMVVLPTVYLLLIGGVAWCSYRGVAGLVSGDITRGFKARILIVTAILVVGITIILFLARPLFAARSRPHKPFTITRGEQPVFFAFVDRLCDLLGAPRPSRIDLDTDANASASFSEGPFSLLTRRLVLTVGLPLVSDLTVRQLGGVLAHEFGHFSQGAGMRLTLVIRWINAWFARIVEAPAAAYGWDSDEEGLADWQFAVLGTIARAGVAASRAILSALMRVGHAVSCFTMRQMEHDADRYATQVAGAEAFEATARRMALLGAGQHLAFKHLSVSWRNGVLANDLPEYVFQHAALLPQEARESIEKLALAQTTGAFDTHPSTQDRVTAARRLGAAGVLPDDRGASALFCGYSKLCRRLTAHVYSERIGPRPRGVRLVDSGILLRQQLDEDRASAAFAEMIGEGVDVEVATIRAETVVPEGELREVTETVRKLRAREVGSGPDVAAWQALRETESELGGQAAALEALRAGIRVDVGELGIAPWSKPEDVEARLAESLRERARLREVCRAALAPSLERIELALGILRREDLRRLVLDGDGVRERAGLWAEALRTVQSSQPKRDRLVLSRDRLLGIDRCRAAADEPKQFAPTLLESLRTLQAELRTLRTELDAVPHPEQSRDREETTLGAVLVPDTAPESIPDVLEASKAAIAASYAFQARALSQLCRETLLVEHGLLDEAGVLQKDARPGSAQASEREHEDESSRELAKEAERILRRCFDAHGGAGRVPEGLSVQPVVENEAVLPVGHLCAVHVDTRTAAVRDHRFLYACAELGSTMDEARQAALEAWGMGFGRAFAAALSGAEPGFQQGDVDVHPGPMKLRGEYPEERESPGRDAVTGLFRVVEPFLEVSQSTSPVTVDLTIDVGEAGVVDGECRIDGQTRADAFARVREFSWPPRNESYTIRQYFVVVERRSRSVL